MFSQYDEDRNFYNNEAYEEALLSWKRVVSTANEFEFEVETDSDGYILIYDAWEDEHRFGDAEDAIDFMRKTPNVKGPIDGIDEDAYLSTL